MIRSNQILDEKDKRLRQKSIDVTFPLDEKYKKFIAGLRSRSYASCFYLESHHTSY